MGMIMEDSDLMGRMRKYKLELIKRSNKSEESIIFFQLFNFHIDERERERERNRLPFNSTPSFFSLISYVRRCMYGTIERNGSNRTYER